MKQQVIIALKDDQGKILLQHRDNKALRYPHLWAFFGGGIENGETPEMALKREAKEELEIDNLQGYRLFGKYILDDKEEFFEEYVFVLPFSVLGISLKELNKRLKDGRGEGKKAGLFYCYDVKNLKTPPYEKTIFDDLCKLAKF